MVGFAVLRLVVVYLPNLVTCLGGLRFVLSDGLFGIVGLVVLASGFHFFVMV